MDPLFLAYLSLTIALVITPGATTAVVVRNTLATGWRGGLAAALGAATGNSTHALAAGLGLAVGIARSPTALTAIQCAGGLYLAWLGVKSLGRLIGQRALPASGAILVAANRPAPAGLPHHAWREGLFVNLLNPPIVTFYLAVVPSFLPTPTPTGYYTRLAATHVGLAFVVHCVWAFSLDRLRHVLERPRARQLLEGLTAVALFLIAARVLSAAMQR